MSVAVAISTKAASGRTVQVLGTFTFSGNYATGGDSVPIASFGAGTTKSPIRVTVAGKAGYHYEYDIANAKVLVRQNKNPADAGGADIPFPELAAAGYPGGVTGDAVTFEAIFPKFG